MKQKQKPHKSYDPDYDKLYKNIMLLFDKFELSKQGNSKQIVIKTKWQLRHDCATTAIINV